MPQPRKSFGCTTMVLAAVAVFASLDAPAAAHPGSGIGVDGEGAVYFTDTGQGPWRIGANGKVVAHAGPAFHFMATDPGGHLAGVRLPVSSTAQMQHAGSKPTLIFSSDVPIVVGHDESLYFPAMGRDGRLQILRLEPSGAHSVLATLPATTEDGPLQWLNGMAAGADGSVYYSENKAIRKVTREGTISTVASSVAIPGCVRPPGYGEKLGPHLRGLDVAADGTILVAATGCSVLVKVSERGEVTPLLRAVDSWSPTGVALRGTDAYVLEYLHDGSEDRRRWLPRVRKLAQDGRISLLAEITRR